MNKYYYGVNIIKIAGILTARGLADNRTINYIARNLRTQDRREIEAQGKDPKEEIISSVMSSKECYGAFYGDEPLALFGIADNIDGTSIWMLGTRNVPKHVKALISCGTEYINEKLKDHETMYNYISMKNKKALRFIEHAGAEIDKDPVVTENGTKFVKFTLRRKHV